MPTTLAVWQSRVARRIRFRTFLDSEIQPYFHSCHLRPTKWYMRRPRTPSPGLGPLKRNPTPRCHAYPTTAYPPVPPVPTPTAHQNKIHPGPQAHTPKGLPIREKRNQQWRETTILSLALNMTGYSYPTQPKTQSLPRPKSHHANPLPQKIPAQERKTQSGRRNTQLQWLHAPPARL